MRCPATGISVDYVVRLEQGRARTPSVQVVTALARALRLDPAERDHLFRCAHLAPPSVENVSRHVPVSVRRLVHHLGETPAAVGDPRAYGWDGRNLVAGMFRTSDAQGRDPVAAWPVWSWKGNEAQEEDLVADLRVTAAARPVIRREPAWPVPTLSERFSWPLCAQQLWLTGTEWWRRPTGHRTFSSTNGNGVFTSAGDTGRMIDAPVVDGSSSGTNGRVRNQFGETPECQCGGTGPRRRTNAICTPMSCSACSGTRRGASTPTR
ncbi:helix-turn-helix domain-containing protein [Streptomyces sp. NPDC004270]